MSIATIPLTAPVGMPQLQVRYPEAQRRICEHHASLP